MIQVPQHARSEEVLVGEHVGQRVDRAPRDAGGPNLLSPLVSGPLAELFLKLRDQGLPIGHAVGIGRIALVLGQLGTAYCLAQIGELGVVADGDHNRFVGGIEGLVWNDGGVGVAYQAGVLAAREILLTAVGEPAEGGLEERNFDARALPRHAAPMQSGQDRVRCEKAADYVRDRNPHLRRFAAGLARDTHDTTPRLYQEVVAGTALIRSRAEARDGTVEETGVRLSQTLVAEAKLLQGAAPPVLDHDVGPRRELPDSLQSFLIFEVYPHR